MNKTVIVIDLETMHTDIDLADPIEFGALAIDPIKLEIIPNSEFNSWCCPDNIIHPNYYDSHKSTIDFHLRNLKLSKDEFLNKVKSSPPEKLVFENFIEYLKKYHTKQSQQTIFSAPVLAGFNSEAFDLPIINRLAKKYGYVDKDGNQKLYFNRDTIDIMKVAKLWLEPLNELKSYSMDSLRGYFGMSNGQAHTAAFDIQQEAKLLIKFLGLHRRLAPSINFKNSFTKV